MNTSGLPLPLVRGDRHWKPYKHATYDSRQTSREQRRHKVSPDGTRRERSRETERKKKKAMKLGPQKGVRLSAERFLEGVLWERPRPGDCVGTSRVSPVVPGGSREVRRGRPPPGNKLHVHADVRGTLRGGGVNDKVSSHFGREQWRAPRRRHSGFRYIVTQPPKLSCSAQLCNVSPLCVL